jgi:hypothetical protein
MFVFSVRYLLFVKRSGAKTSDMQIYKHILKFCVLPRLECCVQYNFYETLKLESDY